MDTNNATEAWILLAIVAPNIQGHNPERVSKLLLANLKYDMVSGSDIFNANFIYFRFPLLLIYIPILLFSSTDKYGGKLLHSAGSSIILAAIFE